MDELRKRIEAMEGRVVGARINTDLAVIRRRLAEHRARAQAATPQAVHFPRQPVSHDNGPATVCPPEPHVSLEEAVEGYESAGPDGGRFYMICMPADGDGPADRLHDACARRLAGGDPGLRQRLGLVEHDHVAPEDLVFLDLETTGLSTSPLFLIGSIIWNERRLLLRQYLARDYSEERAVIAAFLRDSAGKRMIISFNGKSFDVPFLRMRAVANSLPGMTDLPHLDLLHECRRAWRGKLPDCKLQTLEKHVCGRSRTGDIPGWQIPDAYHAFVRTGNAATLATILEHNRLDLVTLAHLLARLP